MSWTKKQFIEQAYEEIGIASYLYDLQSEQLQSAARRLDAMIAAWNAKGIRLGYPITTEPGDVNIDTETNVPDAANLAIYTNLGILLAPGLGKVVSQETKVAAKSAYDGLLARAAQPTEKQFQQTTPRGAGNKPSNRGRDAFFPVPTDPLQPGDDDFFEFE